MWRLIVVVCYLVYLCTFTNAQGSYVSPNPDYYLYESLRCPDYWVQFENSCYRFVKSPLRSYNDSRRICQVSLITLKPITFSSNDFGRPSERIMPLGVAVAMTTLIQITEIQLEVMEDQIYYL